MVLITGIDIFGHLLGRLLGKGKGLAVASFAAGFVSSTSATLSLAKKSSGSGKVDYYTGAALLANTASFFQIFLLVAPLNIAFLLRAAPMILVIIAVSGSLSWYFLSKPHGKDEGAIENIQERKIFSLVPAIKFAVLILAVKIFTKISLIAFGSGGFLASSALASLAGLDAILVNLSEMAGRTVPFTFAILTFIIVNATNLAGKTFYAFLAGGRKFAWRFGLAAFLVSLSALAGLFF